MSFISFVKQLISILYMYLLANYAKCTHCGKVLKHDNETGTSSLIRHMKKTKCKKHLNNGITSFFIEIINCRNKLRAGPGPA